MATPFRSAGSGDPPFPRTTASREHARAPAAGGQGGGGVRRSNAHRTRFRVVTSELHQRTSATPLPQMGRGKAAARPRADRDHRRGGDYIFHWGRLTTRLTRERNSQSRDGYSAGHKWTEYFDVDFDMVVDNPNPTMTQTPNPESQTPKDTKWRMAAEAVATNMAMNSRAQWT